MSAPGCLLAGVIAVIAIIASVIGVAVVAPRGASHDTDGSALSASTNVVPEDLRNTRGLLLLVSVPAFFQETPAIGSRLDQVTQLAGYPIAVTYTNKLETDPTLRLVEFLTQPPYPEDRPVNPVEWSGPNGGVERVGYKATFKCGSALVETRVSWAETAIGTQVRAQLDAIRMELDASCANFK